MAIHQDICQEREVLRASWGYTALLRVIRTPGDPKQHGDQPGCGGCPMICGVWLKPISLWVQWARAAMLWLLIQFLHIELEETFKQVA